MRQLAARAPLILNVETLLDVLRNRPRRCVVGVDRVRDAGAVNRAHAGRREVQHLVPRVVELVSSLDVVGGREIAEASLREHARVRQIPIGREDAQRRVGDLIEAGNQPVGAAGSVHGRGAVWRIALYRPRLVIVDAIDAARHVVDHPGRSRRCPLHLMQLRDTSCSPLSRPSLKTRRR